MCHKTIEEMQEIIDNEYNEAELENALDHINSCIICKKQFENLKNQDVFISDILNKDIDAFTPPNILEDKKRRIFNMNSKMKRFTSIAAVLVIGVGIFTIEPIRAKADEFFKIFRADKVQSISIKDEDLRKISDVLENGKGKVDIEGMISLDAKKTKDIEMTYFNSFEEAKEKMPSLKYPKDLKGYDIKEIKYISGNSATLNIDTDKFNDLLSYLGSDKKLDKKLNDQSIVFETKDSILYDLKKDDKSYISIMQTNKPNVKVPKDLDEQEILDSLMEVDLIPEDLRNQLQSIDNVTIPVIYNEKYQVKEDININGVNGYAIIDKDNSYNSIFLVKDENVYTINSNVDINEIKELLKGMDL